MLRAAVVTPPLPPPHIRAPGWTFAARRTAFRGRCGCRPREPQARSDAAPPASPRARSRAPKDERAAALAAGSQTRPTPPDGAAAKRVLARPAELRSRRGGFRRRRNGVGQRRNGRRQNRLGFSSAGGAAATACCRTSPGQAGGRAAPRPDGWDGRRRDRLGLRERRNGSRQRGRRGAQARAQIDQHRAIGMRDRARRARNDPRLDRSRRLGAIRGRREARTAPDAGEQAQGEHAGARDCPGKRVKDKWRRLNARN